MRAHHYRRHITRVKKLTLAALMGLALLTGAVVHLL
jgi:hypothetical protein